MAQTLYDKIWQNHLIEDMGDQTALIYIDRHIIHEVTSPQAFEGLEINNRKLWRKQSILATCDHNVPTTSRTMTIGDPQSRAQVQALIDNCHKHDLVLYDLQDDRQGIVHVIGPEQGFTLPGLTIVCGDSHTSTHGAFGALAFGIGTSEVEQVLATQTLVLKKAKNMKILVEGDLNKGVGAKDIILAIIAQIGVGGGTGHVIEYMGKAIENLSMAGRMTICNMSIEAGARAGLIAPDATTFAYLEGRPQSPKGKTWEQALNSWRELKSDPAAQFDRTIEIQASALEPQVTWGTSPEMGTSISGTIPHPQSFTDPIQQASVQRALDYMGLQAGTKIQDIPMDQIFIGSCTNARIEDLREAAAFLKGKKIAKNIQRALVVPGSGLVKKQAEQEGLHEIFIDSGFEWREPGCSMCLGMNPDQLPSGQRCASTSNRNFEGRQGKGGRTHLMSPIMAAAAAITGHITDVRELI